MGNPTGRKKGSKDKPPVNHKEYIVNQTFTFDYHVPSGDMLISLHDHPIARVAGMKRMSEARCWAKGYLRGYDIGFDQGVQVAQQKFRLSIGLQE